MHINTGNLKCEQHFFYKYYKKSVVHIGTTRQIFGGNMTVTPLGPNTSASRTDEVVALVNLRILRAGAQERISICGLEFKPVIRTGDGDDAMHQAANRFAEVPGWEPELAILAGSPVLTLKRTK
jgi:hypothetical protein